MRQRKGCALAAAVLAAGMAVPMVRGAASPDDMGTRVVEIPGAGVTVTLPLGWRVWFDEQSGNPAVGYATDVATRQSCAFSLLEGVASAEQAARETVKVVEAQPRYEVVERTSLTVPSGHAVRLTYGPRKRTDDTRFLLSEYYLDVPEGVLSAYCSGDEPPADRWLSVIGSTTPLGTDPLTPPVFDPRVEVPAHGFAIEFPEQWLVRPWSGSGPVLGGQLVLRAVTVASGTGGGGFECLLEDDAVLPTEPAVESPDEWQVELTAVAELNRHQAAEPVVVELGLPAGPAVRADWDRWAGEPATTWIYLDREGRAVASLHCRSAVPPVDGWRSVAATFELLPAAP